MDRYAKYLAITDSLRNETCELELVSRLHTSPGVTTEVTNTRRAVCKRAVRRGNVTELTFVDIDRAALERVFPFETFTVADFPELFTDHVGWRIPQGVGTARKVPLAWVTKTGGTWKYAGPKVIGTIGTVLAVYRGTQPGQGSVVPASEYTVGTMTVPSGVTVITIAFTREQLDFSGRPYVIEADFSLPGSRIPSDEVSRILTLYGITPDTTSFNAATVNDNTLGFAVDALYGYKERGRTGQAIIEDLLFIARGWLSQTSTGAWELIQDTTKASSAEFDTAGDLAQIDEYGDGEIPKTVSLDYYPRTSGLEDFTGHLSRSTVATTGSGERKLRNPYVVDHTVADKLLSYWQKRFNTLREASGYVHAVQLSNGAAIDITSQVTWRGVKKFIITGISRPLDRNSLRLREYDASIYTYTAGTLPTSATNVYSPDYSFTAPLAPTSLQVVSQGTSADNDGKLTAYALIRAVPPVANWSRLMIQITDTTTNEIYQAQLRLVGANYEATVGGLRPNRAHKVVAWAVNANNIEGAVTAEVNFTSANYTTGPSAPATCTVQQRSPRSVELRWGSVAPAAGAPQIRRYIIFRRQGGAYSEVNRINGHTWIDDNVTISLAYDYKVRAEDMVGNESADSPVASITPAKIIDDGMIAPSGVGEGSIANSSISRLKADTSTGSGSVSLSGGGSGAISMEFYTFLPNFANEASATTAYMACKQGNAADDRAVVNFKTDNAVGGSVETNYRYVVA